MLTRSNLNNIEAMIPQASVYFEISLEEYSTIIHDEEEKWRRLKDNTGMIKGQKCVAEKDKLIEDENRTVINEIN